MSKTKLWVVALVGATACQVEFDNESTAVPRHTQIEREAARQMIWNPGPNDVDALERARRTPAIRDDLLGTPLTPGMMATAPPSQLGAALDPTASKRALVLYDRGGDWGALGELYGVGAANLASHFGTWRAKPATSYSCGELATYDVMIYMGSTYDEPLPTCMLDDVLAGTRPVIWSFYNLWKLTNRVGYDAFTQRYGFNWTALDFSTFVGVSYKSQMLDRYEANPSGLLHIAVTPGASAQVLATAWRADGSSLPWAVRSGNLTYIAELPFTYMTEEDRYLAFADMLFDALAPTTPERHRVVLRIEDVSPVDDPVALRAIADYLYAEGIPYGVGVISEYRDPLGWYSGGVPERARLDQEPELVAALNYMTARGGVLVMHGYTHQFQQLLNPYTAVTGDDTEFYRVYENVDHSLTYAGPLPQDTVKRARARIDNASSNFSAAHLTVPTLFEFPHYAASVNAYRAAAQEFTTRWERSLYFPGVLSGKAPSYQWMFGQMFPYAVRDAYGMRVLPENLGNIEPEPFYIFPTRFPADIINAAAKNLVVRDGTAGFYFHPFFDVDYLRETVQGLRGLGYTFVNPADL